MNYFETNLEEISRSIQLLAQIFEYQVFVTGIMRLDISGEMELSSGAS